MSSMKCAHCPPCGMRRGILIQVIIAEFSGALDDSHYELLPEMWLCAGCFSKYIRETAATETAYERLQQERERAFKEKLAAEKKKREEAELV